MTKRPDVLLIITDEHRHDCLGRMSGDLRTPALDRLAEQGTVYENAFCSYPVCAPSRYSIMTGVYAHDHGGVGNSGTIRSSSRTFPEMLRELGYRSAAVGKMHLTPPYLDIGFERMLLSEQNGDGRYLDDYHRHLRAAGRLDGIDVTDQVAHYRDRAPRDYWDRFGAGVSDLPEEFHSTTWTGDRAVEEISQWSAEEANLLAVSFIKPHHPFDPPEPWDRMYDPERLELLPGWIEECLERDLDRSRGYFPHADLTAEALRRVMANYYGSISHIDAQVARLIRQLEESGRYDDTMIVFTSDHGEYMGFHHMLLKGGHMYDPLARVPLIIKYPNGQRPGPDSRLVSHLDLAPTILNCAGASAPGLPGFDLADQHVTRDYVFAESLDPHPEFMVRSENFKLLQGNSAQQSLFFDLRNDPLELVDLSCSLEARTELDRHRSALNGMLDPAAMIEPNTSTDRPEIIGANIPVDQVDQERTMREWVEQQMGVS